MQTFNKVFEKNSLGDETTDKYYEILYGLVSSVNGIDLNVDRHFRSRNYIEYHLKEVCDAEKVDTVSKYLDFKYGTLTDHLKRSVNDKKTLKKLLKINKALDKSKSFRAFNEDAKDICDGKKVSWDETTILYYKIIYGMCRVIETALLKCDKITEITKSYIEAQLGCSCDEIKAKNALALFKRRKEDFSDAYFIELDKQLKNTYEYVDESFDACEMFYKAELDIIEKDFEKVLEVIQGSPSSDFLKQGIEKYILQKHSSVMGEFVAKALIERAIKKSIYSENFISQMAVSDWLFNSCLKANPTGPLRGRVALISLRALNYEKNKGNRPNYSLITDDDLRNVVSVGIDFKKELDEHPFEKENYINKYINEIKNTAFSFNGLNNYLTSWSFSSVIQAVSPYIEFLLMLRYNEYFFDAVCYAALIRCRKSSRWINDSNTDITDSNSIEDVYNIISTYFVNNYCEKAKNKNASHQQHDSYYEEQRRISQQKSADEQRRQDEERRHREDMEQRAKLEQNRLYEEKKQREQEQHRANKEALDRRLAEDRAIRHQCNTCALTANCSMSFRRNNCASYKPR